MRSYHHPLYKNRAGAPNCMIANPTHCLLRLASVSGESGSDMADRPRSVIWRIPNQPNLHQPVASRHVSSVDYFISQSLEFHRAPSTWCGIHSGSRRTPMARWTRQCLLFNLSRRDGQPSNGAYCRRLFVLRHEAKNVSQYANRRFSLVRLLIR